MIRYFRLAKKGRICYGESCGEGRIWNFGSWNTFWSARSAAP